MGTVRRSGAWLGVAAAVALAACGPDPRPSVEAWRATWEDALAVIPPAQQVVPESERCQAVLADLREIRPQLNPGPDEVVDEDVSRWVAYAEHLFYGCFESIDVDEGYERLGRYEQQVEDALASLG